jgi:hypothetical protein
LTGSPDRKTAGRVIANFAQVVKTAVSADRRAGGVGVAGEDGRLARAGRGGVVTTVDKIGLLREVNMIAVGVKDLARIDSGKPLDGADGRLAAAEKER